ncbi:MAG TPA: hypothetical protein VHS31_08385 [Tepidisphaeraceae bacterium]|jgi:hypothetical protein|nr:hypothetical protein [Tepidisphaeraceae bacterium]
MSVGGGFTGLVITLQMLFSPQVNSPPLAIICTIFILLYLFVLISGLLFVHNPQRVMPLAVALVLQIPIVSSPILSFQFVAGCMMGGGVTEAGPFGGVKIGADWQFNVLRALPWGVGINVIPLILFFALAWSVSRQHRRQQAVPSMQMEPVTK